MVKSLRSGHPVCRKIVPFSLFEFPLEKLLQMLCVIFNTIPMNVQSAVDSSSPSFLVCCTHRAFSRIWPVSLPQPGALII